MGYRVRTAIGVIALFTTVAVSTAFADMRGDVYSSQSHQISFARPDAGWELRNHPAHEDGVALFSNGEGTVIALLLHETLKAREVVSSVGELSKRWPALANRIAVMSNAGESGVTVTDSKYNSSDDAITFEITYSSFHPGRGTSLTNWLRGMIVRDNNDQQQIYAIRCAAADGVFSAWESQFDLIMPTLQYTGTAATPVYTGKPLSYWWYGGGAIVALLVLTFMRRGSDSSEELVRRRSVRLPNQPAAVTQPMPVHTAPDLPVAPLPDVSSEQMADGSPMPEELMNVPDSFYYQQVHGKGHEHPDVAPGGPGTTGGFWKCSCGRVNPGEESYCARCNSDRPNDA